jgi:hypothetical protein
VNIYVINVQGFTSNAFKEAGIANRLRVFDATAGFFSKNPTIAADEIIRKTAALM